MKMFSFLRRRWYLPTLGVLHVAVNAYVGIIYVLIGEYTLYSCLIAALFWIALITIMAFSDAHMEKMSGQKEEDHLRSLVEEKENTYWKIIREKEDFFHLWAHQIKTPIAALSVLLQGDEADISACRRELLHIENYVGMALNYARFDNMSNDLCLEPCVLESMVKPLLKKYAPIFIHNHLKVELENLDVMILTDEKWFSFVLEQLLSNALKYTRVGSVQICTKENDAGLEVGILDSGIGIRAEDLPRIFEKGYTGYNGRLDKKASGLGLYLCKGICDKLGHQLQITSTVGKGTSVWIHCPQTSDVGNNLTKL